MQLYNYPASPNSRKVLMVAHLLDIPLEGKCVDLFKGEQKQPAYLALNLNGRVPALIDADLVLWESNAIMEYLAARQSPNALWPGDLRSQADIRRWLYWEQAHFAPACFIIARENLFKPLRGGSPDPVELARGMEEFGSVGAVLNDHLMSRRYLVGDHLTLADIAVACWLMYAEPSRLPIDGYPHLGRWFRAISDTETWRATEARLDRSGVN